MTVERKIYKYIGRNGQIISRVKLDGAITIPMVSITADNGKYVTNGVHQYRSTIIEEEELDEWYEIDAPIEAGQE